MLCSYMTSVYIAGIEKTNIAWTVLVVKMTIVLVLNLEHLSSNMARVNRLVLLRSPWTKKLNFLFKESVIGILYSKNR